MESNNLLDEKSLRRLKNSCAVIFDYLLPFIILLLVPLSLYYVFIIAPDEKIMGPVQRVLYYHVGAAFSSYLMLGVLFVCSIFYFVFNNSLFFIISRAAAGVAFLFSSIVLLSGMIWGYSSWNTWWNWEPRLVSMLILWVFLLSYLYIQNLNNLSFKLRAGISSVLGIICALQVPVVVYSIKLLDRTRQLHPEVVAKGGLTVSEYKYAMLISSFALILLSTYLCWITVRVLLNEDRLKDLRRKMIIKSEG